MEKKTAFMLFVLGLLAVVVLVEVFFYFKNSQQQKIQANLTPESTNPPIELTTDFDPRQNGAIFTIESVDAQQKLLTLKGVYPKSFEGAEVESEITCKDDDIKITTNPVKGDPFEDQVSLDTFFTKLQELPLKDVLFSGYCNDTVCTEISSHCQLSINQQ